MRSVVSSIESMMPFLLRSSVSSLVPVCSQNFRLGWWVPCSMLVWMILSASGLASSKAWLRHQSAPENTPILVKMLGFFHAMSRADKPPKENPAMAISVKCFGWISSLSQGRSSSLMNWV